MGTKYKVILSNAAYNDLDEIFSYIAETQRAEGSAKDFMLEIHKMILSLDEMPQRFRFSLDVSLAQKGYRRVVVKKKYLILYLIDEQSKIVNIARIVHGSTDYAKYA
jgi:addiction module RelE/StbE family toxin